MNSDINNLYDENSNHFIQIQKVVGHISKDAKLLKEFSILDSFEGRFSFMVPICKEMGIDLVFSLEEFTQFQVFTDLLCEIDRNEKLSKEFKAIDDLDKVYEFVERCTKDYKLEDYYTKEAFEKFLFSVSYSKMESITEEHLEGVAGGSDEDIVEKLQKGSQEFKGLFEWGAEIGEQILTLKELFGKDKKTKK